MFLLHEEGVEAQTIEAAEGMEPYRRMRRRERRVKSRGLPSHRGRARKCGIMTQAIRDSFMVSGAGERPVTSLLTSWP